MTRPSTSTILTLLGAALGSWLLLGCFTVTNEAPTYDELDQKEKAAVDTILAELTAFDAAVKKLSKYNIDEVVKREAISVSFEAMMFASTFGDQIIHISTWENLSDNQRALFASWEKTSKEVAEPIYKKLFYQFLAVAQGAKEFLFKVHTPEWVYQHQSFFSIERDGIRTALSYFDSAGRRTEMWSFASAACQPILTQYAAQYGDKFTKQYFVDHYAELAAPDNPVGYMYFICRWIEEGMLEASDFPTELAWLTTLTST
jgi:hypothetical protein